jgi:hypothetical protein
MDVARPVLPLARIDRDEFVADERHERTGSVKFADQADESKEVAVRRTSLSIVVFVRCLC